MTIRSGFYNSVNDDRKYYADDINMPYKKIVTNGVIPVPSSSLQVLANGGLTTKISAGNGIFGDKWLENDAAVVMTHEAAHATLARIDLIVLRVNESESVRDTLPAIIKGTPASNPVAPAYSRTDLINDYVLAQVRVAAGTTIISQSNITDTRPNTTMCGWCTGLIDQVDTETLWLQWQAAGEEAAEENQEAFNTWFNSVRDTLASATLIRQYVNRFDVVADGTTTVPIGINQFNVNLDILEVYVNGWNLIPTTDYTVNESASITLTNAVNTGSAVVFKVFKSIDGSNAETIVSQVVELQNKVDALDGNTYYCNGATDNTALKAYIDAWVASNPVKGTINIEGTFVCDSTTTAVGNVNYSFVYDVPDDIDLTLDFGNCEVINTTKSFMNIKNARVENCDVKFNGSSVSVAAFGGDGATFDNCHVSGNVLNGSGFNLTKSKIINSTVKLTATTAIAGAVVTDCYVRGCTIDVYTTSSFAWAISATTEVRATDCEFIAESDDEDGQPGVGFYGGGYVDNCRCIGSGLYVGNGAYVTGGSCFSVSNSIFRGYTKSANGEGEGIAAANSASNIYLLNGINCNQVSKTGYTQTKSVNLPNGYGTINGVFYAAPTIGSNVTDNGTFIFNRR